MSRFLGSRVTVVWLLLLAATAFSWAVGHGIGLRDDRDAGIAIIVVAFIKVRFVILDFMEIRSAPWFMRIVGESVPAGLCAVLLMVYMRTPA